MLVNVGHENSVNVTKVLAIATPNSAPIKRLVAAARADGELIDLCSGKACRSVIVLETDHVVLSSHRPKLLRERLSRGFVSGATEASESWANGMEGHGYSEPD